MERTLLRRAGAAALLLALLAAGGCDAGSEVERQSSGIQARLSPQERGALRARNDIVAGKLRVYEYGNPVSNFRSRRDPASGLPVRLLLDCCVGEEARAETEAYNRAMREAAAGSRH